MSLQRSVDFDQQPHAARSRVLGDRRLHRAFRRPVRHGLGHLSRADGDRHRRTGHIDKVAGPVGEALIMTAMGLAVAVPAVLGYNWMVRRNKSVSTGSAISRPISMPCSMAGERAGPRPARPVRSAG